MYYITHSSINSIGREFDNSLIDCFRQLTQVEIANFGNCFGLLIEKMSQTFPVARDYSNYFLTHYFAGQKQSQPNDNKIFALNTENLSEELLQNLVKLGYQLFLWNIDDPYTIDLSGPKIKYFKAVFTNEEAVIPFYKKNCSNVFYLPLSFNEVQYRNLASPAPEDKYQSDLCFVGLSFKNSFRNQILIELVKRLSNKYKILLLGGHPMDEEARWENYLGDCHNSRVKIISQLIPRQETARYFLGARINLNIHRDSWGSPLDYNSQKTRAVSPNERLFFLGGLGVFQLVDATRSKIKEMFKVDDEIVLFNDINELVSKVEYYLNNETDRKRIARNLQEKILRNYTFKTAVQTIYQVLSAPV